MKICNPYRRPFRYFNSSPGGQLAAGVVYLRVPQSLRNVENLLFKRGIEICHGVSEAS